MMPSDNPEPLRCYVASPLGFTEGGRDYYNRVLIPTLATVVVPVDPWSTVDVNAIASAAQGTRSAEERLALGRRNIEAMRESDLLVAYLDGQEVDSGTASEVGFAAALGLRCFGLRTDLRRAGDLGAPVNLQVETFIKDSGGSITRSLGDLIETLRTMSRSCRRS